MDAGEALRNIFGFKGFRANQRGIVEALLARRDSFAVMPTGGGKSLCFQLPAHMLPGTCLVISPLISLMKDQVDAANANGLRAAYVNSSQSAADQAAAIKTLKRGELDLIYAAPERFAISDFRRALKKTRLNLIAVDEVHCISEWGHDFRPDYMALAEFVKEFPGVPIAGFTATATTAVQDDTIAKLDMKSPHVVRASFDRPNLSYEVVSKTLLEKQLPRFLAGFKGQTGIVYRTKRADVEETAADLVARGFAARPYHAGLDNAVRTENQNAFDKGEVEVMVATIAFGMGIDKPDVRYVVHGDLPKNIEGYYQQTGRAGRDGRPAVCRLYYDPEDTKVLRYFIRKTDDAKRRAIATRKLDSMIRYATSYQCRRKQLLAYFSEKLEQRPCSGCDVCGGRKG